MRRSRLFTPLAVALLVAATCLGADPPGDAAIKDAIKALQEKKAKAADQADRDKIDRAIAALQKVLETPAVPAPAGGGLQQLITPQALAAKFKGKASYDPKTGELSFRYDFKDQEQLQDFDLGGARPKVVNGSCPVRGAEKFTHVVHFTAVEVTADVLVHKPLGFYLGTTQDLQLYLHDNWEASMWMDGNWTVKKMLPRGEQGKSLRMKMSVTDARVGLQAGTAVMGGVVKDKPRGGQVVLQGGHNDGAFFRNVVITGVPDADWAKAFFGP